MSALGEQYNGILYQSTDFDTSVLGEQYTLAAFGEHYRYIISVYGF